MSLPDWADHSLSRDLPNLRARGEGQDLEYMVSFPQQARDLAKEIAAFASTNPGTILIGVSDEGDIVGAANTGSYPERDELLRRIEGVCKGTIKPSITPAVKWAVEDGRNVIVIQVPKGTEPIYYSNNIPYVRHLSESRPAEPHEVIDRIREWLVEQVKAGGDDPRQDLLNELATILTETLIYAEESEGRNVNPRLAQWRSQCEHAASALRQIAANRLAVQSGMSDDLNKLAESLCAVAHFQLYLGCGPKFDQLTQQATLLLRAVKEKYIDPLPLSKKSIALITDTIGTVQRRLDGFTKRMKDQAYRGRLDDTKSEAASFGLTLLRLAYHRQLNDVYPGLPEQLMEIGRTLHRVEVARIPIDGAVTLNKVLKKIEDASEQLKVVVASLTK